MAYFDFFYFPSVHTGPFFGAEHRATNSDTADRHIVPTPHVV
jgi:hypothetical protein